MTPTQRETALRLADVLQYFVHSDKELHEAADLLRKLAAEPQGEPVADTALVICPACCAQFRAIPVDVQRLMLDAGFEPPFTLPPPQSEPVEWLPMNTAPKDGSSVRLLIKDGEHSLQDENPSVSIGAFGVHGGPEEDPTWDFAGWSWHQDCYCRGSGDPIGWLPLQFAAEPQQEPAPGYCKHCKQYTIEEPLPAKLHDRPVARIAVWWNPSYRGDMECHAELTDFEDCIDQLPAGEHLLYSHPSQRQPLTDEQVWADDGIMSANAVAGLLMPFLMRMVRAVEAAHDIKEAMNEHLG